MSKYFSISLLAFLLMVVPSACSQSKPDSLQLDNPSCITFNNGFKTKNDDAIRGHKTKRIFKREPENEGRT